ncbi:hypothetical protein OIU80_12475 [Flavobacterium sp. LS1R47]|uniref:Uncharacterized protein n=1 Tax=Flavobacterium frigoritolerans TaxID=2987686 RepID=A0A9X3C1D7_9FLAO|nr:hypothetical protein [Flavobacterium frigoritolerans]MCV9933100.1 hypothetical protein [Flavobacterium frigoritolerans]
MYKFNTLALAFTLLSGLTVVQDGNAQSNKGLISTSKTNTELKTENQDQENAKKWLVKTIETNFNKDTYKMSDMTTKTYAEYKSDAINMEYDDGLTEETFKKKWHNQFNTKYVGTGGFLVPSQDYGKIKVMNCKFLSVTKDKAYIFETTIRDLTFKQNYKRDIKVIHSGKSFLIADVKEY